LPSYIILTLFRLFQYFLLLSIGGLEYHVIEGAR
jgi:hypothetical protein